MTAKAPHDAPRCGAKNRSGSNCRQLLPVGHKRCKWHGGASPNALAGVRERLARAVDPALTQLIKIAIDRDDVEDADRIRAIKEILDRGGLPAKSTVEHEGAVPLRVEIIDPGKAPVREPLGNADEP